VSQIWRLSSGFAQVLAETVPHPDSCSEAVEPELSSLA